MALEVKLSIGEPRAVAVCWGCDDLPKVFFAERGEDWWIKEQAFKQSESHFEEHFDHNIVIYLFKPSWPLQNQ